MNIPDNIEIKLEQIMKEAGKLLLSFWQKPLERKQKEQGFVTEADIAIESFLMEKLSVLFEHADFFAEESGQTGSQKNGYHWVIDPLDGTRNFAHSIPYFCISVALTENHMPIVAAIYEPIRDEFYFAQKGLGAYCNHKKISVSKPAHLKQSFIAFGIPYPRKERMHSVQAAESVAVAAAAVRHMGAIALDLANCARGRFDGILFTHLAWWDVAAGILLLQEAGGKISEFNGQPLSPYFRTCIGGSLRIYDSLKKLIK